MYRKRCKNCGCRFYPQKHILNQRYCSKKKCQDARQNAWRKYKLKHDESYKAYRKDIQSKWKNNNPNYWLWYRKGLMRGAKPAEENNRKAEAKKPIVKILLEKGILTNMRKTGVISCNCELVLTP